MYKYIRPTLQAFTSTMTTLPTWRRLYSFTILLFRLSYSSLRHTTHITSCRATLQLAHAHFTNDLSTSSKSPKMSRSASRAVESRTMYPTTSPSRTIFLSVYLGAPKMKATSNIYLSYIQGVQLVRQSSILRICNILKNKG